MGLSTIWQRVIIGRICTFVLEKGYERYAFSYCSHSMLFFTVVDAFLLFAIKYREPGGGDTMEALDCWLLERIQLPEWGQ